MTKEDIEDHRLAALAIGCKFEMCHIDGAGPFPMLHEHGRTSPEGTAVRIWTPLFNAGDSLHLMVAAEMTVSICDGYSSAKTFLGAPRVISGLCADKESTALARTRSAIFRCAVALGKEKEQPSYRDVSVLRRKN